MYRILRGAFRPRLWLGIIGLLAFWISRIFVDIKLGEIGPQRIGHFFMDVAIRKSEHNLGVHSGKVLYGLTPTHQVANTFLRDYASRELNIRSFAGPMVEVAAALRESFGWNPTWFLPAPRTISGPSDRDNVIIRSGFQIQFTNAENAAAHDWLRSVGWNSEGPIVCLLVRDSEYLNVSPGLAPQDFRARSDFWDYHTYRNSDIQTFTPAVKWLVEQGALVLRMGKSMSTPFALPGLFDYAFSPSRSDFLDVWLFANCSMCITTGTGPDLISLHAGQPVVAVNYLPLGQPFVAGRAITAAKALYDRNGIRLSLAETMKANFYRSEDYSRNGISIRDLSSAEILDVVKEGWLRAEGRWQEADYDRRSRERFEQGLIASPHVAPSEIIHPDSRLSSEWLRVLDSEREPFEKTNLSAL